MLLIDARRAARTRPDGALIPLPEQDRGRWDTTAIAEGAALIADSLPRFPVGPYQLQAAIAAVHAEAGSAGDTDWPQILALYELLLRITPNPIVRLSRAVAVAMVRDPEAGLRELPALEGDPRVQGHHRIAGVRAHLLEMAGDEAGARADYLAAARSTTSIPEQRYLEAKAANLTRSAS
jgi:predicted RNA polymerase sigma factor